MDVKPDDFTITCKKCGNEDCTTDRNFWPEMQGECRIVCSNCDIKEFMNECDEEE